MIFHQPHNSKSNYTYNAFVYKDTSYEPHFHKNYELAYVMDGSFDIKINETEFHLEMNEFILIPPYGVHSFKIENSMVWIGVFSSDFISLFSKKADKDTAYFGECKDTYKAFLTSHLFYQGTPEIYILKSCLYAVCDLCDNHAKKFLFNSGGDFKKEVIDYILKNLTENITMKETASALGYEHHYFSSLFHNCFTINFREFINTLRFEIACDLIINTDMDITQIATECGFQSIRNFNKVFKNLSGVTPSEYRKNTAE